MNQNRLTFEQRMIMREIGNDVKTLDELVVRFDYFNDSNPHPFIVGLLAGLVRDGIVAEPMTNHYTKAPKAVQKQTPQTQQTSLF